MAPRPPVLALARLLAEIAVADLVAGEDAPPSEPEPTDEPEPDPPAPPPRHSPA